MGTGLKMYQEHSSWDTADDLWKAQAAEAADNHPLRTLKSLPIMPGITPDTARNLKWKSFRYMIGHDKEQMILRNFVKRPLKYTWTFLKSALKPKSFSRDGDFFLYGLGSLDEFDRLLSDPNSILVVGFSYCHKPHECPSERFTDACIHDLTNPVCQQCFIGRCMHAMPDDRVVPLVIPTVHYIGSKMFDVVHAHPGKRVLFLITACEMTLEMFGDWGNMVGAQGIGVRLDGRICNTMRAFELSEEGIKPGLTVVLPETQEQMMDWLRKRVGK